MIRVMLECWEVTCARRNLRNHASEIWDVTQQHWDVAEQHSPNVENLLDSLLQSEMRGQN
jgi:hypothetical protein